MYFALIFAIVLFSSQGSADDDFLCSDGKEIPISWVNDDYCDCSRGEDESRTSACENSMFACDNKPMPTKQIMSKYVDDLVCDCCDGSDEILHKKCPNTCEQEFQVEKAKQKYIYDKHVNGNRVYESLIIDAENIMNEKKVLLNENEIELNLLSDQFSHIEVLKQEKESIESLEIKKFEKELEDIKTMEEIEKCSNEYLLIDTDNNGILSIPELSQYFKIQNMATMDSIIEKLNIQIDYSTMSNFLDNGNELCHLFINFNLEFLENNEANFSDEENKISQETTVDSDEDSENDYIYDSSSPQDGDKVLDFDQVDKHEVNYPPHLTTLKEETNELRSKHSELKLKIDNTQKKIDSINNFFKYIGINHVFASLFDDCIEFSDNNYYTYKICYFQKVNQISKQDQSSVNLGSFQDIVDLNDSKKIIFKKGDSCWNGIERSAEINISCNSQAKILSVREPSMCFYEIVMESPTVCNTVPFKHDEL
ncbi:hypothetical protein A3Q56_04512 [Intoshia linei]|uniref:Glucosidase 2 subunit beta n=1 Tax=Intoshia linei TaxID=1819745 RepID=A0A177B0H6_9BILA|nr:hypothetical protein A3Q56_04512 [Intoshia linei]